MKPLNFSMIQIMQDSFLQVKIYTYLYNFTAWYRKKVFISFLLNKERNWVYKKQSLKLASLDSQNISTASSTAVVLAPYSLP